MSRHWTEERKAAHSAKMRAKYADPEFAARVKAKRSSFWDDPVKAAEVRRKMSEGQRRRYVDRPKKPDVRDQPCGACGGSLKEDRGKVHRTAKGVVVCNKCYDRNPGPRPESRQGVRDWENTPDLGAPEKVIPAPEPKPAAVKRHDFAGTNIAAWAQRELERVKVDVAKPRHSVGKWVDTKVRVNTITLGVLDLVSVRLDVPRSTLIYYSVLQFLARLDAVSKQEITDAIALLLNPDTACEYPRCGRPRQAQGLCAGHYTQKAKGLALTPLRAYRKRAAKMIAAPAPMPVAEVADAPA